MAYADFLLDPRWQRKRLEMLQRDGFKCRECGESKQTLHVHHRYYVARRFPWEYPDYCYVVLCADCHGDIKLRLVASRESGQSVFEDWEAGLDSYGEEMEAKFFR